MTGIKRRISSLLGPQGKPGVKGDKGDTGLPGPNAIPADEAVAAYIEAESTNTRQAVNAAIDERGPQVLGANVSRTLSKLRSGQDLTIGVIGDSKSDPSTPGNAAGGPVEVLAAMLEDRFGVNVSVVNGAKSGATMASQFLRGDVETVVAAKPDLVVVHIGTNDTNSDANSIYAPGYARAASIAAIERAAAYVRDSREDAEFVFVGTSPYRSLNSPVNDKLVDYAVELKALAATVGAEWVDAYAAFMEYAVEHGSIDDLMYDSTHQNAAGNQLYAETILKHFPATAPDQKLTPALAPRPRQGKYGIDRTDKNTGNLGYAIAAAPTTVGPLRFEVSGTGWTQEGNYDVSATIGDMLTLTADASEFLLNIDIAATPIVDFILDGTLIAADVDIQSLSSKNSTTYWVAPFINLAEGEHVAQLRVKGGTLRVQSTAALINSSATAPGGNGMADVIRTVKVAEQVQTLTLTATYQNLIPLTDIPLPPGWAGMDVNLSGWVSFRTSGETTATRRIDVSLRENGGTVQGTRSTHVEPKSATTNLAPFNFSGLVRGVDRTARVDLIARVDSTEGATLQALQWYIDAILVRTS